MRRLFCLAVLISVVVAPAHAAALNRPAPAFALKNSSQDVRTLKSYRGDVIFIDFWASWCSSCLLELPEINRMAEEYRGKRVRVIAINVDTDRAPAKAFLRKLGMTQPAIEILWDPASKAVSAYNIAAMPASFVIDREGIVRFSHSGFMQKDPPKWRAEIDGLMR